ncbi:MAG: glutamyl-tRNA reductase [Epsilonproteobacteria bacterium]|nr:MAG: glutamyl-tRNA reductase [Campylobacterota bacterium]
MSYLIISYTHKNTDIDTREKLVFGDDNEKDIFVQKLLNQDYISEVMLTSTCNRVELFLFAKDIKKAVAFAIDCLQVHSNIEYEVLFDRASIYDNQNAIYHLFLVASSLDSLVVGETQIIGQIKDAFKYSLSKKYCDKNIVSAINYALKCATSVRNATSLGEGQVSVASTAVAIAKDIFKDSKPQAVVVGVGAMCQIAMRHLLKNGFDTTILNRSYENATKLKKIILNEKPQYKNNITIKRFENLNDILLDTQLLFTATSSQNTIIKQQNIKPSTIHRHWFDMAVPRDIDHIEQTNLSLYAVDDLKLLIDKNIKLRQAEAKEGYKIVKNIQKEFFEHLEQVKLQPIIKHLHLKAQAIIDEKLDKAINKKFIDISNKQNTKKLCQTIIAKLLHEPTTHLKSKNKELNFEQIGKCFNNSFKLI